MAPVIFLLESTDLEVLRGCWGALGRGHSTSPGFWKDPMRLAAWARGGRSLYMQLREPLKILEQEHGRIEASFKNTLM